MKILAITQARVGSTRLPGKILKEINGQSLLNIHIDRILKSKKITQLLIATTTDKVDDALEDFANKVGLPFYRGSVNNVLDRFYQAAIPYKPDLVVRLTSDCTLIDPELIDALIAQVILTDVDYGSIGSTFPEGMDAEVFKYAALEKAWKEAKLDSEKEHVTPYIWKNSTLKGGHKFTSYSYDSSIDYGKVRMSVDEEADYVVIQKLVEKLGTNADWKDYAELYLKDEDIMNQNNFIIRNEGYLKSLKKD